MMPTEVKVHGRTYNPNQNYPHPLPAPSPPPQLSDIKTLWFWTQGQFWIQQRVNNFETASRGASLFLLKSTFDANMATLSSLYPLRSNSTNVPFMQTSSKNGLCERNNALIMHYLVFILRVCREIPRSIAPVEKDTICLKELKKLTLSVCDMILFLTNHYMKLTDEIIWFLLVKNHRA